jgi:hypothetical protein
MNWFKKFFATPMTAEEVDKRIHNAVEVECLKSMQKLELKDGDTLVIRHPYPLKPLDGKNLAEAYRIRLAEYGCNVHVIVFDEGMEIGVLTKPIDVTTHIHLDGKEIASCVAREMKTKGNLRSAVRAAL